MIYVATALGHSAMPICSNVVSTSSTSAARSLQSVRQPSDDGHRFPLHPLVQSLSLEIEVPSALCVVGERRTLAAGESLFGDADVLASVVIVERGLVLHSDSASRYPARLGLCGRGEAFHVGVAGAGFFRKSNAAFVPERAVAVSQAELVVIPMDEVRRLEAQMGFLSELIVKPMSVRTVRECALGNQLAAAPAAQRVAIGLGELARLAEQSGARLLQQGERHEMVELHLPFAELAHWLQVPVSTADTVLRMLERQRMLQTAATRVVAAATAALRALADAIEQRARISETGGWVAA